MLQQHQMLHVHKGHYMIDWTVFYAVSAIFQPYNGGDIINVRVIL